MHKILVIDDNPDICTAIRVLFEIQDYEVFTAETPETGLSLAKEHTVDLVIQDMNFRDDTTSGQEGVGLFNKLREIDENLPVVLLTAWTDLEVAVDLMKSGAADYLGKPWDDTKLSTTVKNLLEVRELRKENHSLKKKSQSKKRQLTENFDLCGIIYHSDGMHELLNLATKVAPSDVPVLITGPNGSGKDMIAKVIQANSSVKDGPFVTVNMGALPEDLMEAELFGAVAGAFTGAQKKRVGRFEAADGGTIFLDEIGNLSAEGQMKLLRVLQTGEYEPLGSSETKKTTVRVISATNADLETAIKDKTFREDLFYRLNVIPLRVPSLSERPEDVLPLAEHFSGDKELSTAAAQVLQQYKWPGNVRELQNMLRRASVLAEGNEITPDLFGGELVIKNPGKQELTAEIITGALENNSGNVSKAAKSLGMSRQSLYRRMEKFGIES